MRCEHTDPALAVISRDEYESLRAAYFSPVNGIESLAEDLVREWGYDPAGRGDLVQAMSEEMAAALMEAGGDVMREHGLKDLRIEPAGEEK